MSREIRRGHSGQGGVRVGDNNGMPPKDIKVTMRKKLSLI